MHQNILLRPTEGSPNFGKTNIVKAYSHGDGLSCEGLGFAKVTTIFLVLVTAKQPRILDRGSTWTIRSLGRFGFPFWALI